MTLTAALAPKLPPALAAMLPATRSKWLSSSAETTTLPSAATVAPSPIQACVPTSTTQTFVAAPIPIGPPARDAATDT